MQLEIHPAFCLKLLLSAPANKKRNLKPKGKLFYFNSFKVCLVFICSVQVNKHAAKMSHLSEIFVARPLCGSVIWRSTQITLKRIGRVTQATIV